MKENQDLKNAIYKCLDKLWTSESPKEVFVKFPSHMHSDDIDALELNLHKATVLQHIDPLLKGYVCIYCDNKEIMISVSEDGKFLRFGF